ncbi:MAG: Cell division protein ZapA [Gemmatimonadaceae bacterium]|nr:Cell division protein ZapA [Gemmatimonadaceae bacterium]
MTDRRNTVRAQIVGEEYTIKSDASAEHTRAVAQYVDQAIKRVLRSGTVVETHKAAILAALQITDELFRERDSRLRLDDEMRNLGADIGRLLPPAMRSGDPNEPSSTS